MHEQEQPPKQENVFYEQFLDEVMPGFKERMQGIQPSVVMDEYIEDVDHIDVAGEEDGGIGKPLSAEVALPELPTPEPQEREARREQV